MMVIISTSRAIDWIMLAPTASAGRRLAVFRFDFAACLLPMSIVLTVRPASFFPDFVCALSHAFLVLHCFPLTFLSDMPQFRSIWEPR
jgi:hypothetical protein